MVKLSLKNKSLIVEGGATDGIFQWEHRIFFTTLAGYRLDELNHRYLFADKKRLISTISETASYLKEERISFETDEDVSKVLQQLRIEQAEYERAKKGVREVTAPKKLLSHAPRIVRPLKPHQQRGLEHLLSVKHGANFSVPGSGKTMVIYTAFENLRREGTVDKLLVIGPRSSFFPWEEEAIKCFGSPLRTVRLTGTKTNRQSAYLQSDDYDLFLCTYQTATNDVDEITSLCRAYKLFVVIDESHNIKRLEGGVWSEAMLNIAPYATRRAILSGTPMPNDFTDLWSQMTFLWPAEQVLGNRDQYRYRCEDENELDSIRQSLHPFFFRTKKSELGLPPVRFTIHKCILKPYQSSIYKALATKILREISTQPGERQMLRQWRKARLVRLLQAASNPTLLNQHSEEFNISPISTEGASIIQLIEKYPEYEIPIKFELINGLANQLLSKNEKVVVWTSFVHNIKMLNNFLKGIKPFVVFGAVPKDESEDVEFNREQQIQQFKETKGPAVLLANPAACAESISLHKASYHAVYLDRTFNCGQYMQSLDRLHRIGLEPGEIVTYHIILAQQTIDETIDRRLSEKQERMLRLLEDELPVGTFEVEQYEMEPTEDEETIDFEEALKDIREEYGSES